MRGTRREWVIAVAGVAIAVIVIGAVIWRARAPLAQHGRHSIYLTNVANGATTLWRSVPDRDLWAPDGRLTGR